MEHRHLAISTLRFVHPDFDDGPWSGFVANGANALATISGPRAIRQALLLLLSTLPGERVRRPEYGCDLHHLLFAPNDATTHGLAIHYVGQAVRRWEPRVEIASVDAVQDPSHPSAILMTLTYTIRDSGMQDSLSLTLDLNNEGA